MDPLTLFALANGAVAAIKKGCQLYKDIKGAAGNIKEVLDDLDKQFSNAHKDKPATVAQRNALVEEKNRVIELNKKKGETDDIYVQIGEHLGNYFDAYNKCKMAIEEEERHSRDELYTGEDSVAKRALQRVLMKKKLEQMLIDLRETVIYQSPPELGALWSDVNAMMDKVFAEQKVHIQRKIRMDQAEARRKERWMKSLRADAYVGGAFLVILICIGFMMVYVAHDAQIRHPEWQEHDARTRLEIIKKEELKRFNLEIERRALARKALLDEFQSSSRHVPNYSESN
jgi:hypothetical protein